MKMSDKQKGTGTMPMSMMDSPTPPTMKKTMKPKKMMNKKKSKPSKEYKFREYVESTSH